MTNSTRQQHFPYLFATYCTATGGWGINKVDTKGKKSQEDISKEFNDLPEDRLKGYESLAAVITELRDGDKL